MKSGVQPPLVQVSSHRPVCSCPQGYRGDPSTGCEKNIVIGGWQGGEQAVVVTLAGGRHAVTSRPQPKSVVVIGQKYNQVIKDDLTISRSTRRHP